MDDLLQAPIPAEENATCNACAMVVPEGVGFSASTKCCTFLPDIWNFLAGAVLLDEDPFAARGRATLEARIDRGVGVTPRGLRRTATYSLIYGKSPSAFGHSTSLLCPHYIDESGGLCGVWRHRESTCTTWFCKFNRGAVGREFWTHLHELLRTAEEALSTWCLLELGVSEAMLANQYRPFVRDKRAPITGADVDGEADSAALDALWGSWRGRERELYAACARAVASLTWADVARTGGIDLEVQGRLTRRAFARLQNGEPPGRPVAALVQITPRPGGRAQLATYSGSDTLDIPGELANALSSFDGRPIGETLAGLEREHRLRVDPGLVRKLADFGVLRDQGEPPMQSR